MPVILNLKVYKITKRGGHRLGCFMNDRELKIKFKHIICLTK